MSDVSVRIKMTQKQAGAIYMRNIDLKEEIDRLKFLVGRATERLSMPTKLIREEGFRTLMRELRAVK